MQEYFGIDFGTTNSTVVGLFHQNVTNYGDEAGLPFPSIVAISKTTGQVEAIGRAAWNCREELSESCKIISSIKTYLGTDEFWRIGPELWTPERVTTEVLMGLKQSVADRGNGANLSDPVVAIPVGFTPEKRKALRQAAKKADLIIKCFISEPTGAVFRNYNKISKSPLVAVFDWGGGTLDISVVHIKVDTIHEVATVSRPIGGDKLDSIIAEWAHKKILEEKDADGPPFSGMESHYRDMLVSQCEEAKRTLSEEDICEISIMRYGNLGTVNLVFIYDDFINLMRNQIEEALLTLEECVNNRARKSFDEIGCILMVGGSSKLRGLREAIDLRKWSCDINLPEDSEWDVAHGAASLVSDFGKYVCAQNIGVRLCDDTIYPLLSLDQQIENSKQVITFGLIEDTETARFVFVEDRNRNDGRIVATDRILGYLSVPTYGFSNEPIHLECHVDENLLLHVLARSDCKGKVHSRTWTYPELRFSYKLPIKE